MRILVVTPAPPGSTRGNRVTAERWARLLGEIGHEVEIAQEWDAEPCDLLVAVHARHSAESVRRSRRLHPDRPIVVLLAGTDLYRDLGEGSEVVETLERADRIVVLQPLARRRLPAATRSQCRVIVQSAVRLNGASEKRSEGGERDAELDAAWGSSPEDSGDRDDRPVRVCMLAHVRPVKDPIVAARAVRRLPADSRLEVVHAGGVLDEATAAALEREIAGLDRYRWLGELERDVARGLLASSSALVVTSRLEGGANVVSEALAEGVPVLSTRVDGSVGLLGEGYPGYFEVGDAEGLAELLGRLERDETFRRRLVDACAELAPMVAPEREREAWRQLLAELRE